MEKKNKKGYVGKTTALEKLQRYCAYQDRCHKEVRSKLLDLGMYGDDLEDIIVSLIQDDFLNEERFARSYARGKFRMKKWGRVKITRELKFRNISPYCLKKGLSEINEEEYLGVLMELLVKKSGSLREKDRYKKRKKLFDYALNKGFETELIRICLKDLTD